MAYIPPHKRHNSKDSDRSHPTPSPIPPSLDPHFKKTLTLTLAPGPRRKDRYGANRIVYAADSIFRWCPVGAPSNGDPIPASFRLAPFDCEIVERREGEKPLILVSAEELQEQVDSSPWMSIAERVIPDLISAALSARNELRSCGDEEAKLYFIARIGKNIFHGGSSVSINFLRKVASTLHSSNTKLRKTFYSNVPNEYMENIQTSVAPKIGFTFHSQKEYYHLKVSDKFRPDLTITCKCAVTKDGKLQLHKVEEHLVRHLVEDISCLYKQLDLRLLLFTRRKMKAIDNEENVAMNDLVNSAVIDPDVKGGLRWSLGKQSAAEQRFNVVGIWHTKNVNLRSNTMKLKLRHADRYDFMSSIGEVSAEVALKLTELANLLKEGDMETSLLEAMVQEAVKLFWDHLLS